MTKALDRRLITKRKVRDPNIAFILEAMVTMSSLLKVSACLRAGGNISSVAGGRGLDGKNLMVSLGRGSPLW